MKSVSSEYARDTAALVITFIAGCWWGFSASAQPAPPSAQSAPPQTAPQATSQTAPAQSQEAWEATMSRTPVPKKGCFESSFPNTEWQEVACTTALPRPYPPARGSRPEIVGNGIDWTASVTDTTISWAHGSFDSVTGVTSETDSRTGNSDTFSLQLNSEFFATSASPCQGAPNHTCTGWQQFLFSTSGCTNSTACVFMQYWLLNYGPTCPSGWNQYGLDCFFNSNSTSVPMQTIAQLRWLRLTGMANSGGMDTVVLSTEDRRHLYRAENQDNVLDLAQHWQVVEFNIFGDCCLSQANFNNGSTLAVRTRVIDGAAIAPTCVQQGFTGETNNLTLVGTPAIAQVEAPAAIVFTESNATGGTPASCASCNADVGFLVSLIFHLLNR